MLTKCGKLFAFIIKDICWKKGWGTTGTSVQFPSTDGPELEWLVSNGYLFHYQRDVINRHRNWRYRHSIENIYGLTKKGWAIAGKYVDAAKKEFKDFELEYQYDYYPRRPEK